MPCRYTPIFRLKCVNFFFFRFLFVGLIFLVILLTYQSELYLGESGISYKTSIKTIFLQNGRSRKELGRLIILPSVTLTVRSVIFGRALCINSVYLRSISFPYFLIIICHEQDTAVLF